MKLSGQHILILGLGESGLAMAQWCARGGARVRVADSRNVPPALLQLHAHVPNAEFIHAPFMAQDKLANEENHHRLLNGISAVALSPGLPLNLSIVEQAQQRGLPVIGEIEFFAHALSDRTLLPQRPKVLAITGTNGKTTTTALTSHLSRAAGYSTATAGNISPAALTALMTCIDSGKLPQVWVLELSSFQLETTHSLSLDAAAVLNISADHLDRHENMERYSAAKARIFQHCPTQILNRQEASVMAMAKPGCRQISFGLDVPRHKLDFGVRVVNNTPSLVQGARNIMPISDIPLAGAHNAANTLAALALCAAIGIDVRLLAQDIRNFRGLPHRVQLIADCHGVRWFDDSKGTNVGATLAAVQGLGAPSIVILGGDGKGQNFSPLAPLLAEKARAVILIGRDADLIREAIAAECAKTNVPVHNATSMEDAVYQSKALARSGDAVLLSPACASFDMFRNYEHRAEVFAAAVRQAVEGTL